jgi:hypothetical protein
MAKGDKQMAYPASTRTLQQWVAEVDRQAGGIKAAAQQQHDRSNAGTLNMDEVRRFFDYLVQTNVLFTQASAVTGIGTYLNTEKQGTVADPVAEFTGMRNAVVATLNWLRTNVPQGAFNSQNYKLAFLFPTDNVTQSSPLVFTAAQTAGYRTVLTTLIGTVG